MSYGVFTGSVHSMRFKLELPITLELNAYNSELLELKTSEVKIAPEMKVIKSLKKKKR